MHLNRIRPRVTQIYLIPSSRQTQAVNILKQFVTLNNPAAYKEQTVLQLLTLSNLVPVTALKDEMEYIKPNLSTEANRDNHIGHIYRYDSKHKQLYQNTAWGLLTNMRIPNMSILIECPAD